MGDIFNNFFFFLFFLVKENGNLIYYQIVSFPIWRFEQVILVLINMNIDFCKSVFLALNLNSLFVNVLNFNKWSNIDFPFLCHTVFLFYFVRYQWSCSSVCSLDSTLFWLATGLGIICQQKVSMPEEHSPLCKFVP